MKISMREVTKAEKAKLKKIYLASIRKIKKNDIEAIINKAPSALYKFSKSLVRKLPDVIYDAKTMYYMLRDWYKGDYEMPWNTAAAAGAALTYLIIPIDLIPDPIPVIGYIDDAYVIRLCLKLIRKDLDRYRDQISSEGDGESDAFCAYCDEELLVNGDGIYECLECHLDFEMYKGQSCFHKNIIYCPKCYFKWEFEKIDKDAEYYCPVCDTLLWSYRDLYYS